MARPSWRNVVSTAADQRGYLGNSLVLPGDEYRIIGRLDRCDQFNLLTLWKVLTERLSAAARGATVCFGRRLSDPEAKRLLGFASGALGSAPSGGLNRPARALARFHPVALRALGFSTPLGMSPGSPSPFGFSAWRISMILAAGMTVSAPPIVGYSASAVAQRGSRARECCRRLQDN
jgi:hypothetical protein